MNRIAFPLKLHMEGAAVADLQAALKLFLDRGIVLGDDDAARRDALLALKREMVESTYAEATRNVVARFQLARRVAAAERGSVDEPTAAAMNVLLQELGALQPGQAPAHRPLVVSGQVRSDDQLPYTGGRVRVFHETPEGGSVRLGEDTTDSEGRYTIRYDEIVELPAELRVALSGADGKPLTSRVIAAARPLEIVDLLAPENAEPAARRVVEGRIMMEHGGPANALRLRLYSRAFGGAEGLLAEGATHGDGRYALDFDGASKAVSLEIRALDGGGREVALSRTLHDLGDAQKIEVNLVAPSSLQPLAPEFRRLSADLQPHVGEIGKLAAAEESERRQDLTMLNRASGWDARLIALAASAARLAADADVGLPHEALYGLMRMGLPSDKLQLARMDAKDVSEALKAAAEAGIVSMNEAQVAEAAKQFKSFAVKSSLALPAPGSRSTYADMLKASGIAQDATQKFAAVFAAHRGSADELWAAAADAGIAPKEIDALQRQGKLAFLTRNSAALTAHLQQRIGDRGLEALVDEGLYAADAWKRQIRTLAGNDERKIAEVIPEAYTGENVGERLDAYADDLARKVRVGYSTDVLRHIVETDPADAFKLGAARAETAALLKRASGAGFRLGETPVEAFVKQRPEIAQQASRSAREGVKTLQRVYQITPSNDAMAVLMRLGLTSAYDVAAYSREEFVGRFGREFADPAEAELVYRKAQQVTSVTYNLFTVAKAVDGMVPLHATSGTPEQHAAAKQGLKDALKDYPTMESLFGSMDYCECEHCRSVLSPAAYLVDLLQFIDPEKTAWDGFLLDWKAKHGGKDYLATYKKPCDALFARRPDLLNIALTCENTNTAMPYIDLVNEILEYYVAHDTLDAAAARDTGDAASEDLLAEPRNVIAEAYERLEAARYPLVLPFDRSTETVRQFCDSLETPLAEVLEALRPSDLLFAPSQGHDRETIFMESLRLSRPEHALFADPDPIPKWHELYGYGSDAQARAIATDPRTGERTDLNSAKALSRRLGITYRELVDVVMTGFVNPRLERLVVLHKLQIAVADVLAYRDNRPLLAQARETLSAPDRAKFDEATAFEARLDALGASLAPFDARAWMAAALADGTFNDVLVLDDRDGGCDFDQTTLAYPFRQTQAQRAADPIAFLRINLFVRLWRKLGWTIEETDRALRAFVPSDTPYAPATLAAAPLRTALIYLAHLKALEAELHLGKGSPIKLSTFWTDLPTTGADPLYAQLFLKSGALQSDAVFDDPLGDYLSAARVAAMAQDRWHEAAQEVPPARKIDPAPFAGNARVKLTYDALAEVQHLSYRGVLSDADKAALAALSASPAWGPLLDAVQARGREFSLVAGHLLALQGALGIDADDVERILAAAGLALASAPLTLANISLLYRHALLARGLKMTVRELIALKALSGLDPFRALPPAAPALIEDDGPFSQTLRFVRVAKQVRDSGLSIDDLEFLLRHRVADPVGPDRPQPEPLLGLVATIAARVRAIRAEHAVPPPDADVAEEALRQKLAFVLRPEAVERLVSMVNATAEFTATRRGVAAADQLAPAALASEPAIRRVSYDATRQEQKLTYRGVLLPARRDALKLAFAGPVFPALADDLAAQARAFFDDQLLRKTVGGDAETGYLDAADYPTLFAPLRPMAQILPADTPAQIDAKVAANEQADRDNLEDLRRRRNRLAAAFYPVVERRLVRQCVVDGMVAFTGADAALVESLACDERLLRAAGEGGVPLSLLEVLAATAAPGIDARFFDSSDGQDPSQAVAPRLASADTSLRAARDTNGNPLNPANSARFDGYLVAPQAGAYRFLASYGKQAAEGDLRFEHLPGRLLCAGAAAADNGETGNGADEYVELKAATPYRFAVRFDKLNGGYARLQVQGEALPRSSLAQLTLLSADGLDRATRALVLLRKSVRLVQALGLSEREVRYLLTHSASFGNLSLASLPTRESDDTPAAARALFGQFLRMAAYARLKREMCGGGEELVDVFEAPPERQVALIAQATRREEPTVRATVNALSSAPPFRNEIPLDRLWDALRVVERIGVPVQSLVAWTRIASASPAQRFAIARGAKEALKARFASETWRGVAKPIFDNLRRRQRDALVGYVMHRHGFTRPDQLYEHFLVDPGMEPVVQTSRIRLAIGSVQLFVQRCLLNLEREVPPAAINARQFEWMKRYRVWEANRKIFLFPENWLEPEFRDDKTHLFAELEGTLLQGDVSSDLAEDAFLAYLRKLEMLARLDIVAMHLEDRADPASNTLHVFGRTHGQPQYFHRRYANRMWTPWEPVGAQVEGIHLAPVAWRDRLYLFWVTFLDKGTTPAQPTGTTAGTKMGDLTLGQMSTHLGNAMSSTWVEATLHWAEYLNGTWLTRESSSAALRRQVGSPFDPASVFVHVSKEAYEDGEERGVFVHLGGEINAAFYLAGRNSAPEPAASEAAPAIPYSHAGSAANRYIARGSMNVTFRRRIVVEDGKPPVETTETPAILRQGDANNGYTLLPCDNAIASLPSEMAALTMPLFYQDNLNTFYVEPTAEERTVEEWREWVAHTPAPEPLPGPHPRDGREKVRVRPAIPHKGPVDPRNPVLEFPVGPESLLGAQPGKDWLVNPGTGLLFDGAVLGAGGRAAMAIMPASEAATRVAGGVATPVALGQGSAVGEGTSVVSLAGGTAAHAAPALNIIGGGGLNASLAGNLGSMNRLGVPAMGAGHMR